MRGPRPQPDTYVNQRSSKRKPPKYAEIVEILHELRVLKMYQKDVAKKHHTTVKAISALSCKYRNDPSFLDMLKQKELEKQSLRATINDVA